MSTLLFDIIVNKNALPNDIRQGNEIIDTL